MKIGKIISVSELGVEILTDGAEVRYRDMLYTELNGKHYRFEVQAVEGSIVNAISFESCAGLKRGLEVYREDSPWNIQTPSSEKYLTLTVTRSMEPKWKSPMYEVSTVSH